MLGRVPPYRDRVSHNRLIIKAISSLPLKSPKVTKKAIVIIMQAILALFFALLSVANGEPRMLTHLQRALTDRFRARGSRPFPTIFPHVP